MNNLLIGDCRNILPTLEAKSVQCVVTSPPYYKLRDYDVEEQIGQEDTVEEYVKNLVDVFREVKRILKDDGTLWLNLGDSYAEKLVLKKVHLLILVNAINKVPIKVHSKGEYIKRLYQDGSNRKI